MEKYTLHDMLEYGYMDPTCHPISGEEALQIFEKGLPGGEPLELLKLYPDNTEAIIESIDDIYSGIEQGLMFGYFLANYEPNLDEYEELRDEVEEYKLNLLKEQLHADYRTAIAMFRNKSSAENVKAHLKNIAPEKIDEIEEALDVFELEVERRVAVKIAAKMLEEGDSLQHVAECIPSLKVSARDMLERHWHSKSWEKK